MLMPTTQQDTHSHHRCNGKIQFYCDILYLASVFCDRFRPAGYPTEPAIRFAAPAIHPRACGELHGTLLWSRVEDGASPRVWEHPVGPQWNMPGGGSSPYARGTPGARPTNRGAARFIPACAGNTADLDVKDGAYAVHPRMRGEHPRALRPVEGLPGSSPHARGTLGVLLGTLALRRFIPACARNTSRGSSPCRGPPVHPRMRGEHAIGQWRLARYRGSSPHARGTRHAHHPNRDHRRFIPACAGNTSAAMDTTKRTSVHPRMRGEHRRRPIWCRSASGSSPHARGTRVVLPQGIEDQRFIPACAGNTRCSARASCATAVHPRMRGEHRDVAFGRRRVVGSSPHARGTHSSLTGCRVLIRFIPACAGNTRLGGFGNRGNTVHPRMRGEHIRQAMDVMMFRGSSPHARGTPWLHPHAHRRTRFIPACAGNTPAATRWAAWAAVHPRMRGEHVDQRGVGGGLHGSSPHARGTHTNGDPFPAETRFIPACAGNTGPPTPTQGAKPVHPRMRGEHSGMVVS